jgi:hypothetical protein
MATDVQRPAFAQIGEMYLEGCGPLRTAIYLNAV